MSAQRVAVLGGSGFVGSAVVQELADAGEVVSVSAPRLEPMAKSFQKTRPSLDVGAIECLVAELQGFNVVINCAGDPDASSADEERLQAANSVLPLAVYEASKQVGVRRFVHVSSAVVQGDRDALDDSRDWRSFSPYSMSKVLAEQWLLEAKEESTQLVIYRPPSVHAPGRGVTLKVARLASSPLRSVAGSGSQPSPQTLLGNVASAISYLATTADTPPEIVHHPWEGLSAADLMRALGGREPHHLPRSLCWTAVGMGRWAERLVPRLAPYRRRVEVMWFGQGVATSWLDVKGWTPPHSGLDQWLDLTTGERTIEGVA